MNSAREIQAIISQRCLRCNKVGTAFCGKCPVHRLNKIKKEKRAKWENEHKR